MNKCFFVVVLLLAVSVCGCDGVADKPSSEDGVPGAEYQQQCERLGEKDQQVFHTLLSDLCSQELWSARDMYDACSWLMVPMHYAFKSGDDYAVGQFHNLFSAFTRFYMMGGDILFDESSRTNRLQWLYLCSQYLALTSSFKSYNSMFILDLLNICIDQASDNLYKTQATWKTERTVEEHIKQVLAGKQYKYHYFSLITDGDGFTLAILSDAVYAARMNKCAVTEEMSNAVQLAYDIYDSPLLNTETDEGGWLFQVGVGQDYRDFIYAGNTDITEDMQPNPREDIVSDVSHFRRNAFFLTSHLSAQESDERKAIFRRRLKQLGVQLKKCIVKVDGNWVQTSFMDGTNGVYRYEYHEEGVGHSNYSHSASLVQGWWAVLYESWIFGVYKDILEGFPWTQDVTNPYWDIITVREQNPYFDCDTAWEKGWYDFVVKCAVQISKMNCE